MSSNGSQQLQTRPTQQKALPGSQLPRADSPTSAALGAQLEADLEARQREAAALQREQEEHLRRVRDRLAMERVAEEKRLAAENERTIRYSGRLGLLGSLCLLGHLGLLGSLSFGASWSFGESWAPGASWRHS